MAIILVLCILVLGYYHIERVPLEKAKLKRGNNWEAYVILAKHGLFYLILGLYAFLSLFILLLFIIFLGSSIIQLLGFDVSIRKSIGFFLRAIDNPVLMPWVLLSLSMFGGIISSKHFVETYHLNKLSSLKNQDGFLNIVLEAMEKSIPIKVSLKSKKVYVGAVYNEQFEQMDFDNLVIVPYLSGYRNKDTLKITFDCNYSDIYNKYGLSGLQEIDEIQSDYQFSDFRLNIRVNEIESISLFYQEIFDDFLQKDKESQKTSLKDKIKDFL